MKKSTFLKLALAIVTVFVFAGANAQTYLTPILDNYVEATEATYQTTGFGLTLIAHPDPVYSPSYDNTTNTGYNTASEWQWSWGAALDANIVQAWSTANSLAITGATITDIGAGNSRTYWVAERFSAACADAVGKSHVINVLMAPTGTMIGANTGSAWEETTPNLEFYRCGENYTDDLTITYTETGVPVGYAEYAYSVTVTRTAYDADGNIVDGPDDVTGTYGGATTADDAGLAVSPNTFTVPTGMLFYNDGTDDFQTKYEFTLAEVASRISAVSVERAGAGDPFFAETDVVTYWLNLPPVTGPIFHIPNNFAL